MPDVLQNIVAATTQQQLDPKTNLPVNANIKMSGGDDKKSTPSVDPLKVISSAQPFEFQTHSYSQRETLPDSYSSYAKYIPNPLFGTDLEEIRSLNQGISGKLGAMAWRALPVTLAKVGQLAGGVFGFGIALPAMGMEALFNQEVTPKSYGYIYDNAMMDIFSGMEEATKNWAPIYKQKQYLNGDLLDKMSTADYWTEDFADGVEFLAAAYLGGIITKPLQVGAAAAEGAAQTGFAATKLGKKIIEAQTYLARAGQGSKPLLSKMLNNWDLKVITTYNTIGEASMEARGVYKDLMHQYEQGSWAKGMPEEAVKKEAGERAAQTFLFNAAILAFPNAIQADAFWGKSSLSKQAIRNIIEGKYNVTSGIKTWASNVGKQMFAEGVWEEGIQSAIQNYESRIYNPVTNNNGLLNDIGGVLVEYGKGFTRTEDQLSMVTGAIIGALGGTAETIMDSSKERRQIQQINKVLGIADAVYNTNYQSLYKQFTTKVKTKNDKGEDVEVDQQTIINPATGKAEIDEQAVARLFNQNILDAQLINEITTAHLNQDKVHERAAKTLAMSRLAMQYFDIPFGMDVLEAKLDMIAEQKAKDPNFSSSEVMEELANNKDLVVKMKSIWDSVKNNSNIRPDDAKERIEFNKKREYAEFYHLLNKEILQDHLTDLESKFSLTNTPEETTKLETKKKETQALIDDNQVIINRLTKEQDAAFKEYEQSSAEAQINLYNKKVEQYQKDVAEIQAKIADPATSEDERKNLNAQLDHETELMDMEAYDLEASLLSTTNPTSIIYNITRQESTRLVTVNGERQGESLFTRLFSNLGHNFFISQQAKDMIRSGATIMDVLSFLKDNKAMPSAMILDAIDELLKSGNTVKSFEKLLSPVLNEILNAVNLSNLKTRDQINTYFGVDEVNTALTIYRNKTRQNELTRDQKLIIAALQSNLIASSDKVDIELFDDGIDDVDLLKDTRLFVNSLSELSLRLSHLSTEFASGSVPSALVAGVINAINGLDSSYITSPFVEGEKIFNIKDMLTKYLIVTDRKSLKKLQDDLQSNDEWITIQEIYKNPKDLNIILEGYLVRSKISAAKAEISQVSEDTYDDVDAITEHLNTLKTVRKSLENKEIHYKTVYGTSPDAGPFAPSVRTDLEDTIRELERLLVIANENRSNKVKHQLESINAAVQQTLRAAGLNFRSDKTGSKIEILNPTFFNSLKSLLTPEKQELLDKLLGSVDISDKNIYEAISEIIVQDLLSSDTKSKELINLFKLVSDSNFDNIISRLLTAKGGAALSKAGSKTISAAEAWKLNPATRVLAMLPYLTSIQDLETDKIQALLNKFKSATGPIAEFIKHRNFFKLRKDLDALIDAQPLTDEQKKNIKDQLSEFLHVSAYQQNIANAAAIVKTNVQTRYANEKALVEKAIKAKKYLPTLQQLIVIRQLVGRMLTGPSTSGGFAYFMLVNGTLGTGKTEIIPRWLMDMLGINTSQVIAIGHNPNTSRQISEKLGTTLSSLEKVLSEDIPDTVKLIVLDEIHTLSFDEVNKLQVKVAAINEKRKGEKLYVLGLGDPFQNTATASGNSVLYDQSAMHPFTNSSISEAFEASPLTVRYRSSVSSINSFVDKFYNKASEISELFAIHNDTATQGVVGLPNVEAVIASILKQSDKTSKAIVYSNTADYEKYKSQLNAAGIDYYDFKDPAKNVFAPNKVQLYHYMDVGGITVDVAYVDINKSDFSDDDLGKYRYNTAMYTALGRAKTLLNVVNPMIRNRVDNSVTTTSIDEDLLMIKELLLSVLEQDRLGLEKLTGRSIDGIVEPDTKEDEPKTEATTETKTETTTTVPPKEPEPVVPTETGTIEESTIKTEPDAKAEEKDAITTLIEDEVEDTDDELMETTDDNQDDIEYGETPPPEVPHIENRVLEDNEMLLEFPRMQGIKDTTTTQIIIVPHENKFHVLTKMKDGDFYVSIGVLSTNEVAILSAKGLLDTSVLTNDGLSATSSFKSYRLLDDSHVALRAELVGAELLRFDYYKGTNTGNGTDTDRAIREKIKTLTDTAPGSTVSIDYRIFKLSGTTDNADIINKELEKNNSKFRVKAGFPYAVVTLTSVEGTVSKYYIRLKARKINEVQNKREFEITRKVSSAVYALEQKFNNQKDGAVKKYNLGNLVFNTIINRLHRYAKVDALGNVSFSKITAVEVNEIIEYLYGDNFVFNKSKISGPSYFKMHKAELPKSPETLRNALLSMLPELNSEGIELVQQYYGVVRKSHVVNSALEGDELTTFLDDELKKKKEEFSKAHPEVSTDNWAFTPMEASPNNYILTSGNDINNRITFYSYAPGKGEFQRFLNVLAKANTLLNADTKSASSAKFIVERTIGNKVIRTAKGFLSMESTSGLNKLAGSLKLFMLHTGGITSSSIIDVDNLETYFDIVTRMHETFFEGDDKMDAYNEFRTSEQMNNARSAVGAIPLKAKTAEEYTTKKAMLNELYSQIQSDMKDYFDGNLTATTALDLNAINYITNAKDANGQHKFLHTQLPITQFNSAMSKGSEQEKLDYLDDRVTSNLLEITPTKVVIKILPPEDKSSSSTKPVINRNKRRGGRFLMKENYEQGLGERVSLDEAFKTLQKLIPTISKDDVRGMSRILNEAGKEAWGRMVNGVVLLEQQQDGTVYNNVALHEVFHLIWNYYLSDAEKALVTKHFVKKYGPMSDLMIEERLALEFQTWRPETSSVKKSLISRILDKILSFFGIVNRYHSSIEDLFFSIHNAKYTNKVSTPVSVSRDMVKIESDFKGNTKHWRIANTAVISALDYFVNPSNVNGIPLPHSQAAFKAYQAILGVEPVYGILNFVEIKEMLLGLKKLEEHITDENSNALKTLLRKYVEDDFTLYDKDPLLTSFGIKSTQEQADFIESLFSASIWEGEDAKSFKTNFEKLAETIMSLEDRHAAYEALTKPNIYLALVQDIDSTINLSFTKSNMTAMLREVNTEFNVDGEDTQAPEDRKLDDSAWKTMLLQIIEADEQNVERNMTMETKLFLSNIFRIKLAEDGTPIYLSDGTPDYQLDEARFRIPINPRFSYYSLLAIMQHIDLTSLPAKQDVLTWFNNQLHAAQTKAGMSSSAHSVVETVKRLAELALSKTSSAGFTYTGTYRFFITENPNDVNTFVYTTNLVKEVELDGVMYKSNEILYKDLFNRDKVITLVDIERINEKYPENPPFVVVKKNKEEFNDVFMDRVLKEHFMNMSVKHRNVEEDIPIIKFEFDSGLGVLVPQILSAVKADKTASYQNAFSKQDLQEIYKSWYNDTVPYLKDLFIQKKVDEYVANGMLKDAAEQQAYIDLEKDFDSSIEDQLKEFLSKKLLAYFYRKSAATDLLATLLTNFSNQRQQNLHVIERKTEYGLLSVRLVKDATLNLRHSYKASVENAIIDKYNAVNNRSNAIKIAQEIRDKIKGISEYSDNTITAWKASVSSLKEKVSVNGRNVSNPVLNSKEEKLLEIVKTVASGLNYKSRSLDKIFDFVMSRSKDQIQLVQMLIELGIITDKTVITPNLGTVNIPQLINDITNFTRRAHEVLVSGRSDETTTEIDNSGEDAVLDSDEEDVLDVSVALADSQRMLNSISSALVYNTESTVNPSVLGADKKKRFLFTLGSYGTKTLSALATKSNKSHFHFLESELEQKTAWIKNKLAERQQSRSELNKMLEELKTEFSDFFYHNPILKARSDYGVKYELIDHDAQKTNENYVVGYPDEAPSEWLERNLIGGFIAAIDNNDDTPHYLQYVWTISNKKRIVGLKTPILESLQVKQFLRDALTQFTSRSSHLQKYVQYFKVDRYINFDILTELIENSDKDAIAFNDYVLGNRTGVDLESIMDNLVEKLYDKINSISDDVFNTVVKNATAFPKDTFTKFRRLIELGIIDGQKEVTLKNGQTIKLEDIKLGSQFKTTVRTGDEVKFTEAEMIRIVVKEMIRIANENYYVNSYFINQMTTGDYSFYKNAMEVIKRLSGTYALGNAPGMLLFAGTHFDVLIGEDLKVKAGYELNEAGDLVEVSGSVFTGTKILGVSGKYTDAQGYMLPERRAVLNASMGSAYRLANVTKPALSEIAQVEIPVEFDKDGKVTKTRIENVPIMLKESVISLEDAICLIDKTGKNVPENWTGLGFLRHNMRMLRTQEYSFFTGVKTGAPSNEYLADSLRMLTDADYWRELELNRPLHTRTLSNANYRQQFNPASVKESAKVRNPGQLIYFANILSGNVENADTIYAMMTSLIEEGLEGVKSLDYKEEDETLSKLEQRVVKSIESPDSLRLRELLDSGISVDNPAVITKWINHLSSYISTKTVEIKFSGNKLVLQSAYGMKVYKTLTNEQYEKAKELQYKEYEYIDSRGVKHKRIYAEVILPSYFKDKVALGDFLYSDMLAFRIPSSELHSAVPLKVAGFYDTNNTNVIIAPKELVPLHGSDFDVDSLFIIRREIMDSPGFKGFGLATTDYNEMLQGVKDKKLRVLNALRNLNRLKSLTLSETTETNELDIIEAKFDQLEKEIAERAEKYNEAFNDLSKFNPEKTEAAFLKWLNLSAADFRRWSDAKKKGETTLPTIGETKTGGKTILQWAKDDYGDKFNLHYLRYSFSLWYNDQSVRWVNEDTSPDVAWQDTSATDVVSNTKQSNTRTVGKKEITTVIEKGEISGRGKWVPYIPKTEALTNAANFLRDELGLAAEKGVSVSEKSLIDSLTTADAAAEASEKSLDLPKLIDERIEELRRLKKEVYQEIASAKQSLEETYDAKAPVGYTRETVTMDGIQKQVWVFDRNFETKFRQSSTGTNPKFVQTVINKYYKNAIIESLLEIVTAERNKERMFSPIMLNEFNAEDENTQETGLYKEGTVFRYLQDVVLDAKKEELDALSEDMRKIKQAKYAQLKVSSDMSNILHSMQSFQSNMEGLELTGVFANEMKAVAYIIKSGYTFYSKGASKLRTIEVDAGRAETSVNGEPTKLVRDLQTLASEIVKLKTTINDLGNPTKDTMDDFFENIKLLTAAENEFQKKLSLLQTDKAGYTVPIEVEVFEGSGNKESMTPIATITQEIGNEIIIDGKSFFQLIDSVENWSMFDALLNAAIDNVKEQILPIINGNIYTANALGAMLMMDMDVKTIALFMSQPATRELSNYRYGVNSIRAHTKKNEIEELLKSKNINVETLPQLTTALLKKGYVQYIDSVDVKDMDAESLIVQLVVLNQYITLSKIGDGLFTLSRALSINKEMPVFVDELMNNKDDWDKIVKFDLDYNSTPNPEFPLYLGDWLKKVPHLLSAVKVRDFLIKKAGDTYMHSTEFGGIIDNIAQLPQIFPNESANRNKVARRFEAIKLIAGTIYDLSNVEDYEYERITTNQKKLQKVLTGAQAFSQRFLFKLDALKRYSNDNVVSENTKKLLDSLQVYKNRWGEWNVKFVQGPSAEYADLVDMENGFRELNNFLHQGELSEFAIDNKGNVTIIPKQSGLFNEFQNSFVTFAALNFGVSFGITNYTSILPKELIKDFDNRLKVAVDHLKSLNEISVVGGVATIGTNLEAIKDKIAIHIVANGFSNLKYLRTEVEGKPLRVSYVSKEYSNGFEQKSARVTSGVDRFTDGTTIYYDLKVNNVLPQLKASNPEDVSTIGDYYPKYIKYGKYSTAYIRVYSTDGFVYYKQIGANYVPVYNLKSLEPYTELTYFDKSDYTHHASKIDVTGNTLEATTLGYVMPDWIEEEFNYLKRLNKPFYIYVVEKTDIDKTKRIKIRVSSVDTANKKITGTVLPNVKMKGYSGILTNEDLIEQQRKGSIIIIPTTDELDSSHPVAKKILTTHNQVVEKVVHVSHSFGTRGNNSNILSPYALNEFTHDRKHYYSPMHAYESWKTGEFDKDVYDDIANNYQVKRAGKVMVKSRDGVLNTPITELMRVSSKTGKGKVELAPSHEVLLSKFVEIAIQQNLNREEIREVISSATSFTVNEESMSPSKSKLNIAILNGLRNAQTGIRETPPPTDITTLGRILKLKANPKETLDRSRVVSELNSLEEEIRSNPTIKYVIPIDLFAKSTESREYYKDVIGIAERNTNVKLFNNVKNVAQLRVVINRLNELTEPMDVNTDGQLSCNA